MAFGHISIPRVDGQPLDDHRRRHEGGHSGGRRCRDSLHGRCSPPVIRRDAARRDDGTDGFPHLPPVGQAEAYPDPTIRISRNSWRPANPSPPPFCRLTTRVGLRVNLVMPLLVDQEQQGPRQTAWEVVTPRKLSIFQKPFTLCGTSPCTPSDTSAQSEAGDHRRREDLADVWRLEVDRDSTPATIPRWSSSIRPRGSSAPISSPGTTTKWPASPRTGAGNRHQGVWFVESRGAAGHAYLDGFDPSAVGRGCDGHVDEAYELPASVRLLKSARQRRSVAGKVVADPHLQPFGYQTSTGTKLAERCSAISSSWTSRIRQSRRSRVAT